jgi:hypothetical protein
MFERTVKKWSWQFQQFKKADWRPILQKYLAGEKFTSGVTADRNCQYAMSSISIQKTIKYGHRRTRHLLTTFTACASPPKKWRSGSKRQAKLEGDAPIVFEINPRFSAMCPMRAAAGVNEPDIIFSS